MRFRLQKGFTLIELIIVMAIMGLLIGVAASSFQTSRIKGKDAKRKSDLKQISAALEAYNSDHGKYPPASSQQGGAITACGATGTSACNWGSAFTDENGTVYMATLPSDANLAAGQQYQYIASSDQKKFQIYAYLENAQDPDIYVYTGKICGPSLTCNYGVSSPNTTPKDTIN